MPRRFTIALFLFAAFPLAVAARAGAEAGRQGPAAEPPKLEPKNFTEKVAGFKTIIDANTKATTKIDLKAQFEMVYVPGGEFTIGSPETEAGPASRTRARSTRRRSATSGCRSSR